MRSIRRIARATIATVQTAHAIGVTTPTSWPAASPTVQSRIDVGRYGHDVDRQQPGDDRHQEQDAQPDRDDRGLARDHGPGREADRGVERDRGDHADEDQSRAAESGQRPVERDHDAGRDARGTSAAATARIAVDEIHFDSQIEPRETGLEATQARVPVSRSWTMRLATAKIAAITKICDAERGQQVRRRIERGHRDAGQLRLREGVADDRSLIAPFAAVRTMNAW